MSGIQDERAEIIQRAERATLVPLTSMLRHEDAVDFAHALVSECRAREEAERRLLSEGRRADALMARVDGLVAALRDLDAWVSRMPDAGFNNQSPRWGWWHERPNVAAVLAGVETPNQPPAPKCRECGDTGWIGWEGHWDPCAKGCVDYIATYPIGGTE